MISLYIDGACRNGQGGWSAIIVDEGGKETRLYGKEENITPNQAELISAIKGLEATPVNSRVSVYSDSRYLIYTMQRKWARRANLHLWRKLEEISKEREVSWNWQPKESLPKLKEVHKLAWGQLQGGVQMVDVSPKPVTLREAVAKAIVRTKPEVLEKVKRGELPKGDVFSAAQIAGIMGAKKTSELIPLCHPLPINNISVEVKLEEGYIEVRSYVKGEGKTGYEMEVLVGAAIAALTIYDMCKGIDPAISLEVKLVRKSGGKSGTVELE